MHADVDGEEEGVGVVEYCYHSLLGAGVNMDFDGTSAHIYTR